MIAAGNVRIVVRPLCILLFFAGPRSVLGSGTFGTLLWLMALPTCILPIRSTLLNTVSARLPHALLPRLSTKVAVVGLRRPHFPAGGTVPTLLPRMCHGLSDPIQKHRVFGMVMLQNLPKMSKTVRLQSDDATIV